MSGHGELVSTVMTLIVLLILGAGVYSYLSTQASSVSITNVYITDYPLCNSGSGLNVTLLFEKPTFVEITGGSLSLQVNGYTVGNSTLYRTLSNQASATICMDLSGLDQPTEEALENGQFYYQVDCVVETSAFVVSQSVPLTFSGQVP
jgi:hypothetical protein